MKIEENKIWLIEHSQELFEEKIVGSLAIILATLLEAENEELIKRTWRRKTDVEAMLILIKNNPQKVEEQWQKDYRQLKKIVDYGGYMEYEEMMLILGLRSDLQSILWFYSEKQNDLNIIDENLLSVLKLNREYTRDCRNANRKNTGGLETYLTKHWWWRYDEETKKQTNQRKNSVHF